MKFERLLLWAVFSCTTSLVISACSSGNGSSSSPRFSDVTSTHLPTDASTHALGVALADVNRDGHLDLVLAMEMQANRLYLNDGTGKYSWKQGVFADQKNDTEHVKVVDMDGDGLLDVIFVAEDDQNHEYYLGNGDGTFRNVSERLLQKSEGNALEVGDVNGDGLPDVLIGNTGDKPRNFLWLNDPEKPGFFIDHSAAGLPSHDDHTQGFRLADLNGDGYPDLVVGNEVPPNRIYFNDGKGNFSEIQGALTEIVPLHTREVQIFDADGDGRPDILFANLTSNGGQWERDPRARIFINQGEGKFTDETEKRMPEQKFSTYAAGIVDFNQDGYPDILLSAIEIPPFEGMQVQALQNDGKGNFHLVTNEVIPKETVGRSWDMAFGDVNSDGITDVVIGGWGSQVRLLLGNK